MGQRVFSVCIVSYQPILLNALRQAFDNEPYANVVACATNADEARAAIEKENPDVILLDCARETRSLECARQTKRKFPGTCVVMLTSSQSIDTAVRALEAGVCGYLTTRATGPEIVDGVKRVLSGETLVCSSLAMKVLSRIRELAQARVTQEQRRLTSREETISELLAIGRTNREIAGLIGVSERTVKHYISTLIQKFSVRNRTELVLAISNNHHRRDVYVN